MGDSAKGREPRVSATTKDEERREAGAAHESDRLPTEEEERLADAVASKLEDSGESKRVAEHHSEMDRIGAEQRGEGRI